MGKKFFYAEGQRMKSLGKPLQSSTLWPYRNDMCTWAWRAFICGYEGVNIQSFPA